MTWTVKIKPIYRILSRKTSIKKFIIGLYGSKLSLRRNKHCNHAIMWSYREMQVENDSFMADGNFHT